jgi:hypothetical protein
VISDPTVLEREYPLLMAVNRASRSKVACLLQCFFASIIPTDGLMLMKMLPVAKEFVC